MCTVKHLYILFNQTISSAFFLTKQYHQPYKLRSVLNNILVYLIQDFIRYGISCLINYTAFLWCHIFYKCWSWVYLDPFAFIYQGFFRIFLCLSHSSSLSYLAVHWIVWRVSGFEKHHHWFYHSCLEDKNPVQLLLWGNFCFVKFAEGTFVRHY